jgi:hypothetical protein
VLFGATKSNMVAGDHSASLLNVDGTADKLTAAAVSLMKRIAKTASPRITPVRVNDDEEWFVCFVNSMSFRDLKGDSTIQQANREAWQRGSDNPIFTDGDLIYDGVILREIEDIPSYAAGASAALVAPAFFCGANAVGYAVAQRTRSVEDEPEDYGRLLGIGIEEIRGIAKLTFGTGSSDTDDLKDNGMVTGWFSAAADA